MEIPWRLAANIKDLETELGILNRIRGEVYERGDPQNDERRREVLDMVHIQREFEELEDGLHPDQSNGIRKLKMKVNKSLKVVKVLKQSTVNWFLDDIPGEKLKRFSHDDLNSITSKFSTLIGSGGFGKVYKGQFPNDGFQVVVKVLIQNKVIDEIFMTEVKTMLKASHPNLIKLYGFCFDFKTKALVYEYMEKGSLDKIVYKKPLGIKWEKLYDIAIETAKGLAYLHHGCDEQVIHHDLKPANVLLGTNFSPKITDFGTARILSRDVSSFTMTKIRGTRGYTAPEMVFQSSRVTYTCDVYSFGMMLFDFLGMRNDTQRESFLPGEVWNNFRKGELDGTIKDCGVSENDKEKATILCAVALWCVQFTPQIRPSMTKVVNVLEKESPVTMPPDPSYSWNMDVSMQQSENFNIEKTPVHSLSTQKVPKEASTMESIVIVLSELPTYTLKQFSVEDIKSFTDNFSIKVRTDEFGKMYEGRFPSGVQVIVKVMLRNFSVSEELFEKEIRKMGDLDHPNVVKLYGYCFDDNMKAIVHEHVKFSLDEILFDKHFEIEWEQLYGIAVGIAKGLAYLHNDSHVPIIHCDVKPGNVILDSHHFPKITNFELAKFLRFSSFKGTNGYRAAEFMIPGARVTAKSDVYSFGKILLEILKRQSNNSKGVWFHTFVWEKFEKGEVDDIMKECGIADKNRENALLLGTVALWCIQYSPGTRPTMNSVVDILENEIQVAMPPYPLTISKPGLSMKPLQEAM